MAENEATGSHAGGVAGIVARLWELEGRVLQTLQGPFLLLIRVVWGVQFMRTGWGKLHNLAGVTAYFTDLGIPAPGFHAGLVGGIELLGGLCLALGLATRVTLVPLTVSMFVAYATADRAALLESTLLDTSPVAHAEPFAFLYTCLVVLLFGPGPFSVDGVLARLATQPASVRNVQALRTSERGTR